MEIWRTFKTTNKTTWEVSTYGRIKKNNKLYTPFERGGRLNNRYLCLSINNPFGGYIHRIVANTFIPNPENKSTVNHIDGDKRNNHISNLEWATYSENFQHALKLGLINNKGPKGPIGPSTKDGKKRLERRENVKTLFKQGKSYKEIAKELNISRQLVRLDLERHENHIKNNQY